MKIKGYNKKNIECKVLEAIRNGEKSIEIEELQISDYIKQLDLLKSWINGMYIPMLANKLFNSGLDSYTNKFIDKRVVLSSDLLHSKEFFDYVDTDSDFRKLYCNGIDEKRKKIYSFNRLKLNFDDN